MKKIVNYFDLTGLNIFITGSSGHLGKEMALCLAKAGAHIYLNGRTKSKLLKIQSAFKKKGLSCSIACFDVSNKKSLKIFFKNKKINIIINNAYIQKIQKDFKKNSLELTNVKNLIDLIEISKKNLIAAANKNLKSSIINISSIYSITSPNPKNYTSKKQKGNVSYGVEKVSINRLIKYYAAELGKYNITINNIIPGAFPNDNVIKKYPKFIKNLKNSTVINKIGRPHDLNTLMLFLSSKYTRFITGSDIVIDGGWTII